MKIFILFFTIKNAIFEMMNFLQQNVQIATGFFHAHKIFVFSVTH